MNCLIGIIDKIFIFIICLHQLTTGHVYEEVSEALSKNLRTVLLALGASANESHPQLGLQRPFDPLPAVAPLRYTNEGDLLKLRLLLNNVTLKGLSSLAIQEVTFNVPGGRMHIPSEIQNLPSSFVESTTMKSTSTERISEYLKPIESDSEDENMQNMYDYYYYDKPLSPSFLERTDYEYQTSEMEDYDDPSADIDYTSNNDLRYRRDINKERHHRHTKSKHDKIPKHHRRNMEDGNTTAKKNAIGREARMQSTENQKFKAVRHSHRKNQSSIQMKLLNNQEEITTLKRASRAPNKSLVLTSNVRISFSNLKIEAFYVVKGSAGGVFTFKEQGRLVLTLPNVFITSIFNVTLIPEISGLRHWKNGRNHVRVQKVRTRISIETPKLRLIPASRPPEWVRKQVEEKMEELGAGVGRRDGAIRLLLRQWARLLRKLVLKAAKDSSNGRAPFK